MALFEKMNENNLVKDVIAYINGIRAASYCRSWDYSMRLLEQAFNELNEINESSKIDKIDDKKKVDRSNEISDENNENKNISEIKDQNDISEMNTKDNSNIIRATLKKRNKKHKNDMNAILVTIITNLKYYDKHNGYDSTLALKRSQEIFAWIINRGIPPSEATMVKHTH